MVEEIGPARVDRRHIGASRELEMLEGFIGSDPAALGTVPCRKGFDDRCMDGILGATNGRLRAGILEGQIETQPQD